MCNVFVVIELETNRWLPFSELKIALQINLLATVNGKAKCQVKTQRRLDGRRNNNFVWIRLIWLIVTKLSMRT